jgi:flagella basal body P-ring formation protein FlgA
VVCAGSVELRARAVALNNAYVGQTLLVKRVDDGAKFTGLVEPGPLVVVE